MRALSVIVLAALTVAAGCQTVPFAGEVGSGTARTEQRTVGGFDSIRVAAAVVATVSIGSPASVTVTADDNLLDNVTTRVVGSRLEIGATGSFQARTQVRATVVVPTISALEATSAGRIDVADLELDALRVAADSAGRVNVAGRVATLDAHAGSAGELELGGTDVTDATVVLDSSAHAWLSVSGKVGGSVTTSAVLTLVRRPATVEVSASLSGRVEGG
jgi:hypothetical protein